MNEDGSIPFLGLITALEAETRTLCGKARSISTPPFRRNEFEFEGARVVCLQCGPGPERSLAAARALVREGAGMLLCSGVSGGLDPEVRSGDLILTEGCMLAEEEMPLPIPTPRQELAADAADALEQAGISVLVRPILTTRAPLLDMDRKTRWFAVSGAASVDMESAGTALAAMEADLPFLALRAICDPADRPIPPEMLTACSPDGGVKLGGLFRGILRRPRLLGELWRTGRDYSRALDALAKARAPLFRFCLTVMSGNVMAQDNADADSGAANPPLQ
ncbi:MAG: hypothetical protein V3573_01510 [Desulfovibrionaceae bacterium]